MIRSIIVDDEPHCIKALSTDLARHCPGVAVLDTCQSAKEGMLSIRRNKPQLVFLDVEMPLMNGFEMLELIGDIDFNIIFTTAFDRFAARAFRISAVDYLLKPVDAGDLVEAVRKAEDRMMASGGTGNILNLLHNISLPVQEQRIALPNRDGYEFVPANDILYCTAEGSYTKVFLSNKHTLLLSRTLGDVEEMLPPELFVRIHHSTIVNIREVTHYIRTDGGYVVMRTNEKLMVSKSKKDQLLQKLGLRS
jgi:two-component system LytT family response regulator